jgi:hypothetical protein
MVANCANPACKQEFRELHKGRLFLLPPSHDFAKMWEVPRLIDHCYWLCPDCACSHTIELEENRPTVRSLQRELRGAPGSSFGPTNPAV